MYPTEVVLNEKNQAKLIATLKKAYSSIVGEINTATDFGVANRRAILSQIEQKLTDLNISVDDFIKQEIPKYYKSGADDAVKQLNNAGAPVKVAEGFNRIHDEAVLALIDDTSKSFGTTMTGVARNADLLLGKATREQITQKLAEGTIGGKALREVRQTIKGVLQEQGIAALVDKGGNTWQLDRYADMLFRTKLVEARNRGLANRMVENDYDLVQVSNHGSSHRECAVWEGKILSATGNTPGYPTIADAERAGLFHPNCQHAINILIPSLARKTRAYDPDTKTLSPEEAGVDKLARPSKQETYTAYRGTGNKLNISRGFEAYGKGTYYSLDESYAKTFGKTTESKIKLENPLIIKSQQGLEENTKQMIADGYSDLGKWAKSKGHDAIIDTQVDILLHL